MLTIEKLAQLEKSLQNLNRVAVAFSGGVDSTFLAAAAYRALKDQAVAITAYSETLPEWERQASQELARQIGIRHVLLPISELNSQDFVQNNAKRCYYCKHERYAAIGRWAKQEGYDWVLDGTNADDLQDYRPGLQALAEMAFVKSPLLEVKLTKAEIRQLSQSWGLPTWNKPSAACLSSRIAYGMNITPDRLKQVELAEKAIRDLCPGQVRVRHHGNLARIEVEAEYIPLLTKSEIAEKIAQELVKLGFSYVTLDLRGYSSGSMNKEL